MKRALPALFALLVVFLAAPAASARKVNVNSAGASELASVPGIDARLAARIVAYRAANGPFKSLDDLLKVPGFTKLTMVKAVDHIEAGAPPRTRRSSPPGGKKVDLNRASFAELLLVPEMTPRMAKAIVDYRDQNGPYRSVRELQRVPGLDKVKLVTVLNHVRVARPSTPRPTPTPRRVAVSTRTRPPATPTPRRVVRRTPRPRRTPTPVAVIERTPAPTPEPHTAGILEDGTVDLNNATIEELLSLPRMTAEAAREIVTWRQANGSFQTKRDLIEVPLFGEAAYQRLKDKIAVSTP